jgi:hypothetical protein
LKSGLEDVECFFCEEFINWLNFMISKKKSNAIALKALCVFTSYSDNICIVFSDIVFKLIQTEKPSYIFRSELCQIILNFSSFEHPDLFNFIRQDFVLSLLTYSLRHCKIVVSIDAFISLCSIVINIGSTMIEKIFCILPNFRTIVFEYIDLNDPIVIPNCIKTLFFILSYFSHSNSNHFQILLESLPNHSPGKLYSVMSDFTYILPNTFEMAQAILKYLEMR